VEKYYKSTIYSIIIDLTKRIIRSYTKVFVKTPFIDPVKQDDQVPAEFIVRRKDLIKNRSIIGGYPTTSLCSGEERGKNADSGVVDA